jgi:hypothetical protein
MIVEDMEKIGGPCSLCTVAFGVSGSFGHVLNDQCVFLWCPFWYLSYQLMQCGYYVRIFLSYVSYSIIGSGVGLLLLVSQISLCLINV